MGTKSLLMVFAVLVFASPAFSQFAPQNRLTDMAGRLSREAGDFADSTYSNFSNNNRGSRNDTEAVMLAHEFAGASQIFYRMVVDRRRPQDLRDAFDILQNLARSVERNTSQQSNWYNIQRLLSDMSREVSSGGGGGGGGQYPDSGNRSGRMTWRGRVDDDVRIRIRGGSADVETVGGTAYYDAQPNFSNSLPNRRVTVRLTQKSGRGEIFIEQQPSRENDFTAIVRIRDTKGGASDYSFTLEW